ncbi:MAG: hypothetical protein JWO06_854 [Bacteroidota bacterium]|nr:hypothetical protein [Bacteroidota bacterium]
MPAHNENARLETFCDGVFAIAITLLVLEIKVPPIESIHSSAELWQAMGHLWPSFFAFGLSFLIILIAWVGHHSVFKIYQRSSPQFIYANGFFLFTIVLFPFATALMAEYIKTDYAQPAVVFYSFSCLLQNVGWTLIFETGLRPMPLTNDHGHIATLKQSRRVGWSGFIVYIFITILAWWFPYVSLAINTLLWFIWLAVGLTYNNKS